MGKKNMFSSISQWDFGVAANWTLINFLKTQLSSNSYLLCCLVTKLCPTLLKPQELEPTRLFGPLGFLGKSAGGGYHFLLQGILPVHELNLSLVSSALAGRHFTTAPLGKPLFYLYLNINMSNSVQFLSHDWLFATPWTAASRLSCPSSTPGACSNSCPENSWCLQPSHPLLSPSPPAFNLLQHQGLFQWVNSLHHVAKVLEFQLQHQFFQWIFRTDFL